MTAATLKRDGPELFLLRRWILPRSNDRGHIEAERPALACADQRSGLPRSNDRGHIEAMQAVRSTESCGSLPRSNDRGHIEAKGSLYGVVPPNNLPRSNDRGH